MTTVLPVPYGTYGHTPRYVLSKDGSIYTTAIGDMGKRQPWKSRVWRITPDSRAEIVLEVPATLALFVVNGQLLCVWIDPTDGGGKNAKIKVTPIGGYIPLDGQPSGTVVNINASQIALVNQRIDTAQFNAGKAQGTADKLQGTVNAHGKAIADLQARVAKLEKQGGGGGGGLTRQQVEDIVWSKIWDINFLIRQGFRDGVSGIREVQDYIVDLTTYIRRIIK